VQTSLYYFPIQTLSIEATEGSKLQRKGLKPCVHPCRGVLIIYPFLLPTCVEDVQVVGSALRVAPSEYDKVLFDGTHAMCGAGGGHPQVHLEGI